MAGRLLYLHGFNSSPQSLKAQQLKEHCAQFHPELEVVIPQLANTPLAAWQQISQLFEQGERPLGVVGSSLGGFFATRVSELYGCPSVVINPAVAPHRLLHDYLGWQANPYSGEKYLLTEEHMEELAELAIPTLKAPQRIWLLQQQGDEVLDYREALNYYHFARTTIECGGDHAFSGFERYCEQIVHFLQT